LDGASLGSYENLDKEKIKKELELPEEKIIVAYTGALVMNKGIQLLLEAIPLVLKKKTNIYFVIAGFPAEQAIKYVNEKNLSDWVRIVSPLDYFELPKILVASDIGVDPKDSSTKQASGKILQYMAAGLPVVCFDRENNRAYLGEGAEYCNEISPESLAQGILEFSGDRQKMQSKGDLNKKQIENFSWEKSAEKIEAVYEAIER